MITITEPAIKKLNELREEEGVDQGYFIRVSVVGGGCSGLSYKLDFDNEDKEGDQVSDDGKYAFQRAPFLDDSGEPIVDEAEEEQEEKQEEEQEEGQEEER